VCLSVQQYQTEVKNVSTGNIEHFNVNAPLHLPDRTIHILNSSSIHVYFKEIPIEGDIVFSIGIIFVIFGFLRLSVVLFQEFSVLESV
jgi:hypothetical protein